MNTLTITLDETTLVASQQRRFDDLYKRTGALDDQAITELSEVVGDIFFAQMHIWWARKPRAQVIVWGK